MPSLRLARADIELRGMSATGTKRTYRFAPHMSGFGGKADIPFNWDSGADTMLFPAKDRYAA